MMRWILSGLRAWPTWQDGLGRNAAGVQSVNDLDTSCLNLEFKFDYESRLTAIRLGQRRCHARSYERIFKARQAV